MAKRIAQTKLLQDGLDKAMLRTVKVAALVLGFVFLAFAVIHPFVWPDYIAIRLSSVAVLNCLILFGLYLYLNHTKIIPHYAHYLGLGLSGLLILDFFYQMWLIPEPIQTTNLMLLVIGAGILFVSFRLFLLILLVTMCGWLVFVLSVGFNPEWIHYGSALISAIMLGIIAHLVRVYNLKRFNKLNQELEQRVLGRTKELEEANNNLQKEINERRLAEMRKKDQEEKFQKIFENANDGIVYLQCDGRIITVNQKMEEVCGYSKQELIGHYFFSHEMFSSNGTSSIEQMISKNGNMGRKLNDVVDPPLRTLELLNKNGQLVVLEITTTIVSQNGNGENGYLIHLRDITEKRETQKKLLLQSAALRAAPLGILITGVDGTIHWANPAAEKLTGYPIDELIGQTPNLFNSGRHKRNFYEEMWQTILSGETWEGMIINKKKNGLCYPEALSITPVYDGLGEISSFIAIKQDITEKIEAQDALLESSEQFQELFEQINEGVFRVTLRNGLVLANSRLAAILDFESVEELLSTKSNPTDYLSQQSLIELREAFTNTGTVQNFETQVFTRTDREILISLNIVKRIDQQTGIVFYEGTVRDITAEKNLKLQLIQAQKMEAVGQLSTGVAHDFNNLLTVIKGYTQLLLAEINYDQNHEYYNNLVQVDTAAKRAESLTRQLLAFSRRQILEPKVLDMNEIIRNLEKMLFRLIEENIDLDIRYDDELSRIKVDSGQIEQVIINLIVNARDAMPDGGKLRVQTDNVQISEFSLEAQNGVPPNEYVRISISDSGIGMDEATQSKIFEPFFTTKAEGKGTGLGLATVYGNIMKAEGFILVDSAPGVGTTFTIYLPAVRETADEEITHATKKEGFEGSETILVVEDQAELRKVIVETLQLFGYHVLEAHDSRDAINIVTEYGGTIELLLTDVVMPDMNGKEVSNEISKYRPEVEVLYMSGYTDDVIAEYDILAEGVPFLQKPFTPMDLGTKIRGVLD